MAVDEAPPFWWRKNAWQAWLLAPIGIAYGKAAQKRMEQAPTAEVPVPVICVGNFIVGGAGKTPTVQMLSRFARSKGLRPGVLTRGHGGAVTTPTVVNREKHNSHDVGDEALLHARHAVTVVSADRARGAEMLMEKGCDVILMDDGFQNPVLKKDFNLVVVDAKRGLGNGFPVPAGPVRVPFRDQVKHADAVLVIGEGNGGDQVIRRCARSGKPVFLANILPTGINKLSDPQYFAYAGIGDPEKFFETLENGGVQIAGRESFGDHHVFTDLECEDLMEKAEKLEATLITTAKDAVRLAKRGKAQEKLLDASEVLHITLDADDPNMLQRILSVAEERCDQRRLAMAKS